MSQTRPIRVLCVFGTRPDAVKMAPVVLELQRSPQDFEVRVVVTGQHREQLDQVLRVFELTPDHDLAIMTHGQTLAQITTRALEGLDADLQAHPADICLAQGDTTTTFVAGLAAFYHKVAYGHVEAGLRTGNLYDPFPEEMNRRLASELATWHFAPTEPARQNLLAEGISSDRIYVTGNTSIDALRSVASREYAFEDPALHGIVSGKQRLILVTAHRRENWGEPMADIARALAQLASEFTDCEIVVAMHRNPIVRDTLRPLLGAVPRVHLIEPPDYVPFVKLMQRSTLILTDSGGVQEEAPSLGVPILVLRQTTERPEGVTAGNAKLIGTDTDAIVQEARLLLTDPQRHAEMSQGVNPYGDGSAAKRIVDVLRQSPPKG
ncbi:MAG: UDP-N-Acetylglucosamine 2-epimerase [Chthonomonadales bacterium]|nr:UDP-N-Acetylglucosamine 2-epimerase [Chthonomonadales bacterium]